MECEPLAPSDCKQGEGCYYSEGARTFECAKAGSAATGASCAQDADCVPRDGCAYWVSDADTGVCKAFCSVQTGSGCTSPDICVDMGDATVGMCGTCPVALQCGSGCCKWSEICSAGVCSTPTTCDPVTQNCTTAGQACYYHWGGGQFVCQNSTGHVAEGQACTLDTECAKSSGCYYRDNALDAGVCASYCKPVTSPTTCKSGKTCKDDLGDGSLGYCQ